MYEKEFKSMDDDSRIEIKDEDDRGVSPRSFNYLSGSFPSLIHSIPVVSQLGSDCSSM